MRSSRAQTRAPRRRRQGRKPVGVAPQSASLEAANRAGDFPFPSLLEPRQPSPRAASTTASTVCPSLEGRSPSGPPRSRLWWRARKSTAKSSPSTAQQPGLAAHVPGAGRSRGLSRSEGHDGRISPRLGRRNVPGVAPQAAHNRPTRVRCCELQTHSGRRQRSRAR